MGGHAGARPASTVRVGRARPVYAWLPSDDVLYVALAEDDTAYVATTGGLAILKQKKMTLAEKAEH